MRRILSLTALACLFAAPALGAGGTLCAGRVELLSVSPQWNMQAQGRAAIGLSVTIANRTGEAILIQPLLMMAGRPHQGNPLMLTRHGETVFALRVPAEQREGVPPEALIQALGASCRLS
jgi:hypothetical protein